MESSWLQSVLNWVEMHPQATGFMIFIVALGESLLLVGILLPGAAILVGLGTLIGLGVLDLKVAWIAASLGAIAGDGISFWIGYHYKEKLLKMWPMYKFPKLIDQGQAFFSKWGTLSVFIGRFVGLVRPIIPAIAGVMGMPVKKYIIISIVAAILWSPFYLLPGMLFGSAMGSMAKVTGKLAILLGLFILAVAVFYWLIQLIYGFLFPRTYRILSKVLIWSQKHPTLGKITSGLVDPRKPEKGSLAFITTFTIAISIVSLVFILNSQTIALWSTQVNNFMLAFHTDWTEPVMLFILALNHDLSILIPAIIVLLWLIRRKRKTAAIHWAFIVISSYVLAFCIHYFSKELPNQWYGFHHLAWFVAVIAYWAAFISGTLPHRIRTWPYTLATVLIATVSFTQLFFAQMSLGTAIISILSGIFLAAVVAIALRMRQRKQLLGWPVSSMFFIIQGITVIAILVFFSQEVKKPIPLNSIEMTEQQWLNKPLIKRQDWLNRSQQAFTINFHGSIANLNKQLQQHGFKQHKPSAWTDFWHALNHDEEKSKSASIIPTTDNGRIETIIYSKAINDELLTLHFWKQPIKINGSQIQTYAGYASKNSIAQKWGLTFWQSTNHNQAKDNFVSIIKGDKDINIIKSDQQIFLSVLQP